MDKKKENQDERPVALVIGEVPPQDTSAPEQAHDGPGKPEPPSAALEPATDHGSTERRARTGAHAGQPDPVCVSHEPNIAAPPVQSEVAAGVSVVEALALASTVPEQGETQAKSLVAAGGQNTGQGQAGIGQSRLIIRTQKCFVPDCEYVEARNGRTLHDHCVQVHGHTCLNACPQCQRSLSTARQFVNDHPVDVWYSCEQLASSAAGTPVDATGTDALMAASVGDDPVDVWQSCEQLFPLLAEGVWALPRDAYSLDLVNVNRPKAEDNGGQVPTEGGLPVDDGPDRGDTPPPLVECVAPERYYRCLVIGCCNRNVTFEYLHEFQQHVQDYHRKVYQEVGHFQCARCEQVFADVGELRHHFARHQESGIGRTLYVCSNCGHFYASHNDLMEHDGRDHQPRQPKGCFKSCFSFGH